jgi:hypothetical protein
MNTIQQMWERLQEMFRQPTDLERWLALRSPTNAADLDQLLKEWNYKQFRDIY